MLDFYNLREQPFGVTPASRFFYASPMHREALASLVCGIEYRVGFAALVSAPGMGKTTLLFQLLEQYHSSARTAFIFNTQCDTRELLHSIGEELEIDTEGHDPAKFISDFNLFLTRAAASKPVIIIIDEAQNLQQQAFETIRLLSNFEKQNHKLLHIILAGQPELLEKLRQPQLLQLFQRITMISRIQSFSEQETADYIRHRLTLAGSRQPELFSTRALQRIHACSEGVPRSINRMCFNAMLIGRALRKAQIDEQVIDEVITDLDLPRLLPESAMVGSVQDETVTTTRDSSMEEHTETRAAAETIAIEQAFRTAPVPVPSSAANAECPPHDINAMATASEIGERASVRSIASARSVAHLEPFRAAVACAVLVMGIIALWLFVLPSFRDSRILGGKRGLAEIPVVGASPKLNSAPTANERPEVHGDTGLRETAAEPSLTIASHPDPSGTERHQLQRASAGTGIGQHAGHVIMGPVAEPTATLSAGEGLSANAHFPRDVSQSEEAVPDMWIKGESSAGDGVIAAVLNSVTPTPPTLSAASHKPDSVEPTRINTVRPVYPAAALASRVEGDVLLNVDIGSDGRVKGVHVTKGDPVLTASASEAVKQWRYTPRLVNGQPADAEIKVRVVFRLNATNTASKEY